MAALETISSSDYSQEAVGKINRNNASLNADIGSSGGSGGAGATGIIARNADAVQRIWAAKKHLDLTHTDWTNSDNHNSQKQMFCIAHGSDFHLDNARYGNFRDFVDGVTAIDVAVNTGDMCYYGTAAEMAYQQQVEFTRIQPLLCIGNHDRWGGLSDTAIATNLGMEDGLYYYKDYTDSMGQKVRIIVLNRYDKDNASSSTSKLEGIFTSAQIEWFMDVLDDCIDESMNVIVMMHAVDAQVRPKTNDKGFWQRHYQWQNKAYWSESGPIIEDIIAAFKTGGTASGTYSFQTSGVSSITINHSFSSAGKFVCYIVGHAHIDTSGYSSITGHGDQLYLSCPASCCYPDYQDFADPFEIGAEVSDLPRVIGTKSEDCFNVYGFDFVNKIVKVVRIGADMNDLMEKREATYFEYDPSNS